jgi:SAM-dependent methyltransferase
MEDLFKRGWSWFRGKLPGRRMLGRAFGEFSLEEQREEMAGLLIAETGNVVTSGPFAGMELPTEFCWGDGHRLPKLLGSYEAELHPWLEAIVKQPYDLIVDIGCAEGYYVAGLARAFPAPTRIYGFDISRNAQRICRSACEKNHVSDRVTIGGRCGAEEISSLLSQAKRPLLLVDCEGGEVALLCDNRDPALDFADILVECHDFMDRTITPKLYRRFSDTHNIERVEERNRDPEQFPFLRKFGGFQRALAVCEFRPEPMHWLLCTSNRHPARAPLESSLETSQNE